MKDEQNIQQPDRYLLAYDRVKQYSIRQQMQTLAGRQQCRWQMGNQMLADETCRAREEQTRILLANLDGWKEEIYSRRRKVCRDGVEVSGFEYSAFSRPTSEQ